MASVIIFLNADQNKSLYVLDEFFIVHFLLQIEQNVYSICTYSASDVTQIIDKMYGKIAKRHIFESMPFLHSSAFSGYKGVCRASNGRRVYQQKEIFEQDR